MKLTHKAIDANESVETFFTQMGKFALLIGTTPAFGRIHMDMAMSLIHGALSNNTYALYEDDEGKPVAGLICAFMDKKTSDFYLDYGVMPDVDAWRSGPDLWFLNIVAEGGALKVLLSDLRVTLFKDNAEAFMLRPGRNGRRRVVRLTHKGMQVVRVMERKDPE